MCSDQHELPKENRKDDDSIRGQSRGECICRSPTAKASDANHGYPAELQARLGLAGLMNLRRKENV